MSQLKQITFGASVKFINESVFEHCDNLATVIYTGTVADWCDIVFATLYSNPINRCRDLFIDNEVVYDLVIPEGVTKISSFTFRDYYRLKRLTLPESLTSIGSAAFRDCYGIFEIYNKSKLKITDNNSWDLHAEYVYSNEDGSKFETDANGFVIFDGKKLVKYIGAEHNVVVPEGVKSIEQFAFSGPNIYSVVISDSVTTVSSDAFAFCINLVHVTIGSGVTELHSGAFNQSYRVTEICNKSQLNIAPDNSFDLNNVLRVYTPQDGESKITTDADGFVIFDGTTLINYLGDATELTIPTGITTIHNYAFYGIKLTKLTIPASVTSVYEAVPGIQEHIGDCPIRFEGTIAQWQQVEKDTALKFTNVECSDGWTQAGTN